ncbi:MAG: PfkB family carbohydrate kinase [bacterium]|nr:PfkB family carbohydrate kinase [bacterium]
MKKALVVGSVAFDMIFGIHGKIQDEILVEKDGTLGRQNLMFTAKTREHFWGGTGGNIAYGLGLLGTKPLLFSLAGKDFEGSGFESHLKKVGVDSRVIVDAKGWTATFYGMSDELGQQIGVYQPNAYEAVDKISLAKTLSKKDLAEVGVAIFSAGTGKSIYRHMKELWEKLGKKVLIIFDPGQVISIFYDKKLLEETLKLADIFIGNEVECKQMENILGYGHEKLLDRGLKAIIETKGETGSVIYEAGKTTRIPARKVAKVVEATGAGDAYRAGLIYGILEGADLAAACRIGSYLGAKNVGTRGGQMYQVDARDFKLLK